MDMDGPPVAPHLEAKVVHGAGTVTVRDSDFGKQLILCRGLA
jgi:hypothetical protein